MQIQKVSVSSISVGADEASVLRKKLAERQYSMAIASHIADILHQLNVTDTLQLGGMQLVAFDAVLRDIVADPQTQGDDVLKLQQAHQKVKAEVTNRYFEIIRQM